MIPRTSSALLVLFLSGHTTLLSGRKGHLARLLYLWVDEMRGPDLVPGAVPVSPTPARSFCRIGPGVFKL